MPWGTPRSHLQPPGTVQEPQVVVADGAMLGGVHPGAGSSWGTACGFQAHQELPPLPPCQGAEPCPLPSALD